MLPEGVLPVPHLQCLTPGFALATYSWPANKTNSFISPGCNHCTLKQALRFVPLSYSGKPALF